MARGLCILIGVILLAPVSVLAQSPPTTSLPVSLTLLNQCTVSTSPVDFGATHPQGIFDAEGAVTVRCPNGLPYSIWLDGGAHYDGLIWSRMLESATGWRHEYKLFQDSARVVTWGMESMYGAEKTGTGNGSDQAHVVYGRLSVNPAAHTGLATDTVNVTVNF